MSIKKLNKEDIKERALKAIETGKTEEQAEVMQEWMEIVAQEVAEKVTKEQATFQNDTMILTNRGAKQLTSEEVKYFEKLAECMQAKNVKQALTDMEVGMPTTTINRVFDDLVEAHPLLSKIKAMNVTGITEVIKRTGDVEEAWWGPLTDKIKKELEAGFKKESTTLYKLSAFLPIAKAYLVLGPAWLETYIRTILTESISKGLVKAIVTGTGVNQPYGMDRDLEAAVTPGQPVPRKTAIKIKNFEPKTLGKIIAKLTNNGQRVVTKVTLIVNPVDYWEKVWALTTTKNALGQYIANQFPFPVDIIQEPSVAINEAVIGLSEKYDLSVGMNQKVEYSDEFRFLDDERVYITKLYANGKARDNNAFFLLDISEVTVEDTNNVSTTGTNDSKK
jgi:HK97 family phage major capsid protein|nr:MAG TPA: major capsid protein [Caudoviricetes sp.]